MQQNNGLKSNYMLRIRLTSEQENRLKQLVSMEGAKTMSEYCRRKLFEALSTEMKLNKILELLAKNDKNKKLTNGK